MRTEGLKQGGIDYDGGVKRFMGRAALYEKILLRFPTDDTFARIRADYLAGDMDKLINDAHELKGVSGNIALTRLHESADRLVSLLRGGTYEEGDLAQAYERLTRDYTAANQAILAAMEEA